MSHPRPLPYVLMACLWWAAGPAIAHADDLAPEATAPTIDALLEAAWGEDADAAIHAVRALGARGESARATLPRLLDLVRERGPFAVVVVGESVAGFGPKIVPALVECTIDDDDPGLRSCACLALGRIRPVGAEAVAALADTLRDDDMGVRSFAAGALADQGADAHAAIPALVRILPNEPESAVRLNIVHALSRMPGRDPTIVTGLCHALEDSDEEIWTTAARALAARGAFAVPGLRNVLKRGAVAARPVAAWALALLGPLAESARPDLEHALTSRDPRLRKAALGALARMGVPPKRE